MLRRTPRIFNLEEPKRQPAIRFHKESGEIAVEPPLREKLPTEEQMEIEREAREWWFQNTPQMFKDGRNIGIDILLNAGYPIFRY